MVQLILTGLYRPLPMLLILLPIHLALTYGVLYSYVIVELLLLHLWVHAHTLTAPLTAYAHCFTCGYTLIGSLPYSRPTLIAPPVGLMYALTLHSLRSLLHSCSLICSFIHVYIPYALSTLRGNRLQDMQTSPTNTRHTKQSLFSSPCGCDIYSFIGSILPCSAYHSNNTHSHHRPQYTTHTSYGKQEITHRNPRHTLKNLQLISTGTRRYFLPTPKNHQRHPTRQKPHQRHSLDGGRGPSDSPGVERTTNGHDPQTEQRPRTSQRMEAHRPI